MAIIFTKMVLTYILGGFAAIIGLTLMTLPTAIRMIASGKDYDAYVDEAYELLREKHRNSKLYQIVYTMPVWKFNALMIALWPVMGPYVALMFSEMLKTMHQLDFNEKGP